MDAGVLSHVAALRRRDERDTIVSCRIIPGEPPFVNGRRMRPERAAGEIHRGIDWLEAQGSMKTAIMTDTNSGIGAQEAQRLGVSVLPMPVVIDGVSYLEGAEIEVAQLYKAMKQ